MLHCGRNDLAYKAPEDVAENIIRMVQEIKKHGIGCSVSTLITRKDNRDLNENFKVKKVNHLLNNSLGKNTAIIDHTNINDYHLNNGELHLNHRSDGALAHNLIQHIRKLEF